MKVSTKQRLFKLLALASFLCLILSACDVADDNKQDSLSPPPEVTEVTFGGVNYPLDVKEIILDGTAAEISLEELKQLQLCTNLETLHITKPNVGGDMETMDISLLGQHTALKKLTLGGMKFTGVEKLSSQFPYLEELHLWYSDGVSLPAMDSLRSLYISKCADFRWEALSSMVVLETLYMGDDETLPEISLISGHPTLNNIIIHLHYSYFLTHQKPGESWDSPLVIDSAEDPCPDWLPYSAEEIQTFVSQEGAEFVVMEYRGDTDPRFVTVPHYGNE